MSKTTHTGHPITLVMFLLYIILLQDIAVSRSERCETSYKDSSRSLQLYAKDPGTWKIIHGGPGAVLNFDIKSGIFTLRAHGLVPRVDYSLVRYAGDPPAGDFLAHGISDSKGALVITGIWKIWKNKMWLVPSVDITTEGKTARLKVWRPEHCLFEEKELPGIDPKSRIHSSINFY